MDDVEKNQNIVCILCESIPSDESLLVADLDSTKFANWWLESFDIQMDQSLLENKSAQICKFCISDASVAEKSSQVERKNAVDWWESRPLNSYEHGLTKSCSVVLEPLTEEMIQLASGKSSVNSNLVSMSCTVDVEEVPISPIACEANDKHSGSKSSANSVSCSVSNVSGRTPEKLKCQSCQKGFSNLALLQLHLIYCTKTKQAEKSKSFVKNAVKLPDKLPSNCKSRILPDKVTSNHKSRTDPFLTKFMNCFYCDELMEVKFLRSHYRLAHPSTAHPCHQPGCRECFYCEAEMWEHFDKKHSKKLIQCTSKLCYLRFENTAAMQLHVQKDHDGDETLSASLKCCKEGKTNFFDACLSGIKVTYCDRCSEKFYSATDSHSQYSHALHCRAKNNLQATPVAKPINLLKNVLEVPYNSNVFAHAKEENCNAVSNLKSEQNVQIQKEVPEQYIKIVHGCFCCKICQLLFRNIQQLREHITEKHL